MAGPVGHLGQGVDGGGAGLPVAGAQLVGLEGVELAQDLFGVATHGAGGDGHRLDDVVGVDDEGGAVGHPVGVQDAQGAHQLALEVAGHGEGEVLELVVAAAPGVVRVLVVHRDADDLAVAVLELVVQVAEGGDLGGAHEGEVLGPEEHDAPGALGDGGGDGGEVVLGLVRGDVLEVAGDDGGELVVGELIADGENGHGYLLRAVGRACWDPIGSGPCGAAGKRLMKRSISVARRLAARG